MLSTIVTIALLASANAAVTVCPKLGSISEGLRYHHDSLCDRAEYNRFKNGLGRPYKCASFKARGGVKTVPSEKTVKCPAGGAVLDLREAHQPDSGLDTVFFVENASSGPVVVSFVDEFGMEVSGKNPCSSTSTNHLLVRLFAEKRQKPRDHSGNSRSGSHCRHWCLYGGLCF